MGEMLSAMDATDERTRVTPAHPRTADDPAERFARARGERGAASRSTVLVCSDQHLVAETICAALGSRGFPTQLVEWAPPGSGPLVPRPQARGEGVAVGRVLLLACDLDVPGRLGEARDLGPRYGLPWLVVDALPPGPAWGALLEAGARTVVVSSLSLDELVEALDAVARGGSTLSELERRVLIRQWREVRESPEHLLRQLHSVDEEDREILVMLYEGTTIRAVADRFGLSEAAVRAQVKAMLRRLSASSRVGGTDAGGEAGGLETRAHRS